MPKSKLQTLASVEEELVDSIIEKDEVKAPIVRDLPKPPAPARKVEAVKKPSLPSVYISPAPTQRSSVKAFAMINGNVVSKTFKSGISEPAVTKEEKAEMDMLVRKFTTSKGQYIRKASDLNSETHERNKLQYKHAVEQVTRDVSDKALVAILIAGLKKQYNIS